MVGQLIDGKALAHEIKKEIAEEIHARKAQGLRAPGLAVILVGEDPASTIYVRNKHHACQEVRMHSIYHPLPETVSEKELITLIHQLNQDNTIDGILLQLPLPSHLQSDHILEHIDPKKDVDGFHPYNLGRLAQRRPALRPCTPMGVILLLDQIHESYQGRHAVMVGASNIVGRPMALELLMKGCTVTICHRLTDPLDAFVKQADILISAVGHPGIIKGEWIKPGATVIDIGITRLEDGSLRGDVEFDTARTRAAFITPVPGGVGPMTVAMLLKNTLSACKSH